MLSKKIRMNTGSVGLLAAGSAIAFNCALPVQAQTAVSAAQPSAAPASADAAPAPAAAAPAEPAQIPHSEMIHRTLYMIYIKQNNPDLAASELDALMTAKPNDATFPFFYGQLLMKAEKWPEALAKFQLSSKLDPEFSNAYDAAGDCQQKLKKFAEAVALYTEASKHAKAGQDYSQKISIAKAKLERQQQEEAFNRAAARATGGAKPASKKK
jgi:predicted Zn-dependent protease